MKYVLFILIVFAFSKPGLGQPANYCDSCDTNGKFYQGRLPGIENGSYIYYISKHSSFIELSAITWGSLVTKYRVERQSNGQTYTVTKTVENRISPTSTSTSYVAIDSNIYNALQLAETHFKYLEDQHICIAVNPKEPIFPGYFSGFIAEHNLQNQFLNFNPRSFVA